MEVARIAIWRAFQAEMPRKAAPVLAFDADQINNRKWNQRALSESRMASSPVFWFCVDLTSGMLRSFRKLIAQIGIAAMLLSQLAVAAYACPTMKSVNCGEASMVMDSADAGEPTSDLPALCQKHCQNDQQSYGDLLSPLISVALAPSFVVTLDVAPGPSVVLPAAYHALLHAASPPLTIRNCCFRI